MKRLSDNSLTMLLPLTMLAATAFSLITAVAFRMGATTAGFVLNPNHSQGCGNSRRMWDVFIRTLFAS